MSRGIQVRTLEPREYDVWNEFVESSPMGSVYAMPECLDALNDVRPFLERGWTARPSYTLVVPLQDLDTYWKRVDGNVRRLARRARQEGVRVSEDDDFDAFFQLHREVHERKGAPLYLSRQPFEAYFRALRAADLVRLYHARLQDGRPVAGQLVVMNGHPVTHTVSAASNAENGKSGASVFLRCEVFADLHRRGYRANDLTGAGPGSVTRFKSQFRGDLEMCFEISRTRPGFHALRMPALLDRESRGWARRVLSPLRGNYHAL